MISQSMRPTLGLVLLGVSFTSGFLLPAAPGSQSQTPVLPTTTNSTDTSPIDNTTTSSQSPISWNNKDPNCIAGNLSAQTWKDLKLDDYLTNYSGGQNLTLSQYADSKGAQNFKCGIEEDCTIGQICDPVPAPDWYILLSVQEWNNCMNSVYKAVHFATSIVQGTLALMVSELTNRNMSPAAYAFDASSLAMLIASFSAVMTLGIDLLFLAGYVGALYTILTTFGVISVASGFLAGNGFTISSLLSDGPEDKKSFVAWGDIGHVFSQWESGLHTKISNTTQAVINAPISSSSGISSVLKNGVFLYDTQPKTTADLQTEYATVIQARSLNLVLRSMGAYITRGGEKCDGRGPNGSRGGDEYLSYCTSDKIMMNIVLAKGDQTENKIHNAKMISAKFGFTTEYLVNQSWNCQSKYKKFEYDPYQDSPLPSDPDQDCIINLPVCDLSDLRIDKARKGKHHHTTKACRVQGGLPI
ncbi:hypothetical protein DFH28DRAFT_949444 [Melampsora americana]|nr:hypothetical protein DFH28DRAFT_949444 [Melampsora americana]